MKKFRYVGPHDEVEVPAVGVVVERGSTIEVEDPEVAAGFEDQDIWEHVPDPERSKAAKKAAETRAADED